MFFTTQTYPVNGLAHHRDEDIRGVLDRWSNVLADDDEIPSAGNGHWLATGVAPARVGADATNALHAASSLYAFRAENATSYASSKYGEEASYSRTRPHLLVKERKAARPRPTYGGFEDPLTLWAGATQYESMVFHPHRPHATTRAAPQFDGKACGWKPSGSIPAANQARTATSCDIAAPKPMQPGGTPLVQLLHEAAVEILRDACDSHGPTQRSTQDPEDTGNTSDDSGYTYNLLENPYDSTSDGSSTRWSAGADRGIETGRYDTDALYDAGSKYTVKHAGYSGRLNHVSGITEAGDKTCSEGATYEYPIDLTFDAGSGLASVEPMQECAGGDARRSPVGASGGGWELERSWFDEAAIWTWRARVECS